MSPVKALVAVVGMLVFGRAPAPDTGGFPASVA